MYFKNIFGTLISKGFILILNFFIVVITTNFWGSEGRGIVSLIIADISILAIINNVFAGSCINYFTPKVGFDILLAPALMWVFLMSFIGSVFFIIIQPELKLWYISSLTLFNSLFAINQLYYTSVQDFKRFNLYSLLLPVLTIIFILVSELLFKLHSAYSYLYSFASALFILWVIGFIKISANINFNKIKIDVNIIKLVAKYGSQTELSYFIHFLNYRLAYFLILHYSGVKSLGVYSVGIAIAEAIWVIAQSISTVQYTHIVNNIANENGIQITKSSARISLYFSLLAVFIIIILPNDFFYFIFGKDFGQVKNITMLLFPGVIAMALSNIYGHYFSAIGKTKILVLKSVIGLILTLALAPIFLPKWGIYGACVVTSCSYLASSLYLGFIFYRENIFNIKDFYLLKRDFTNVKP